MAIVFAVLSMLFAAANDFVFKIATRKGASVGLLMAAVGVVWAAVFAISACLVNADLGASLNWRWGLISGGFSAFANVLLIEGMARNPVGICATVYRLNLAPAAIIAFLVLGESLTGYKGAGLVLAVVAVLMLSTSRPGKEEHSIHPGALWLVVVAAFLRAGMGITYKMGILAGAERFPMLAVNGCVWIVSGSLYHFFRHRLETDRGRKSLCWGTLSGVLVCGIVFFMMIALEAGEASVVLPVAQLSFLLTTLFGIVWLHEGISRRSIVGILCAVGCIVLLAMAG